MTLVVRASCFLPTLLFDQPLNPALFLCPAVLQLHDWAEIRLRQLQIMSGWLYAFSIAFKSLTL
jgi:hypothetical protein